MSDITILIVEDHPLYRDALAECVARSFANARLYVCRSVEAALREGLDSQTVGVVLLDPGLPGQCGAEAVASIQRAFPLAKLVVLSASENRRDVTSVLRAGAHCYVSKAVSTDTLMTLVAKLLEGQPLEQPVWMTMSDISEISLDGDTEFTPRQCQIMELILQGKSNKEIGLQLLLSEATVKMHVSCIFRTLGVTSRTQAIAVVRQRGLMPLTSDVSLR